MLTFSRVSANLAVATFKVNNIGRGFGSSDVALAFVIVSEVYCDRMIRFQGVQ
jgi:hypothetical protein